MKNIVKKVINIGMYLLGVFFILGGITNIFDGILPTGILIVVAGIILLPIVSNFAGNKLSYSFKKENTVKLITSIFIFIFAISIYPMDGTTESVNQEGTKGKDQTCARVLTVADDEDLNMKKLECYEFGKVLSKTFEDLGIDDIKNIRIDTYFSNDMIQMIIKGGIANLHCTMFYDKNEESWSVYEIENNEKSDIKYYVKNNYVDYEKTILDENIYSYKTQEIVQKVDDEKRTEYYANIRQEEENKSQAKKVEIIKKSQEDIAIIYNDFNNNKLSAEEKHKGKEYTFVGYFNGANNDGIVNKVAGLISVEIVVKDANGQEYLLYCDFDSGDWKEKLTTLNNGDEVILKGDCSNWGNWSDCEIVEIK